MVCCKHLTSSACKVDCEALESEHPTLPTHKTNYPLCLPQQQAMMYLAQCAMYDSDRIAPNGLSLQAVAVAEVLLALQQLAVGLLECAPPQSHPMCTDVCVAGLAEIGRSRCNRTQLSDVRRLRYH